MDFGSSLVQQDSLTMTTEYLYRKYNLEAIALLFQNLGFNSLEQMSWNFLDARFNLPTCS